MDLGLALRHAARLPLANRRRCRRPACVRDARAAGRPAVIQNVAADPAGFTPTVTGRPTRPPSRTNWAARRRSGSTSRPSRKPLATLQTAGRRPAATCSPGTAAADGRALPDRGCARSGRGGHGDDERRPEPDTLGIRDPARRHLTERRRPRGRAGGVLHSRGPARESVHPARHGRRGFGLRLAPAARAPHDHVARRRPRRRLLGDIDRHGLGGRSLSCCRCGSTVSSRA